MKLTNLSIISFTSLLSSDAPAPGGGSTSALVGALGSALTAMVLNLTKDKKKYEVHQNLVSETLHKVEKINESFLKAIDDDTESFNKVSTVFSMPKTTEEEKEIRSNALQVALKGCTEPPFTMMSLSLETLKLIGPILNKSNENAISDLGVAALCLNTSVKGAWLNVLINLNTIKDIDFKNKYKKNGEQIVTDASNLSDEIYSTILKSLS
ncbi:MAG: cyclodeaminase/cyclohydrolase family protein [Oscillospiraceae bacterium]